MGHTNIMNLVEERQNSFLPVGKEREAGQWLHVSAHCLLGWAGRKLCWSSETGWATLLLSEWWDWSLEGFPLGRPTQIEKCLTKCANVTVTHKVIWLFNTWLGPNLFWVVGVHKGVWSGICHCIFLLGSTWVLTYYAFSWYDCFFLSNICKNSYMPRVE